MIQSWQKTDVSRTRLHIGYSGPINDVYYCITISVSDQKLLSVESDCNKYNQGTFSRFGFPKNLVSDNGAQFTGREFKEFCKSLCIGHVVN